MPRKENHRAVRKPARSAATKRTTSPSTRKVIPFVQGLHKSVMPLSRAVRVGNLLFCSGTTPFAPDGTMAKGDFAAQMHRVMANIKEMLKSGGSSLERVAKVNVILVRMSDFKEMNQIYRQYFKEGNYPARTTVESPLADPDFLLEIECVAEASGPVRLSG
jgi:2-iminobutanoate/2-iminopropanoate deaminase